MRAKARPLFVRSAPLWAFLLLMCVSTLWSVEPGITFKNALELIGTTLVGFYIVTRFTLPQFMTIFALTFSTIALVSLGFIFGAPAHGRMDWGAGAWSGIYQDKNNLGAAAALAIISQVLLLAYSRGRARWIVFAGLLLFCGLLLGSNSATAFGSCAAVVAVPLSVMAWRSRKYAGISRILLVVGGLLVAMLVVAIGLTPDSVFSLLGRQSNLTGRADFWPYLQQAISDQPWLGYGYNAFFRSTVGAEYLSNYVIRAGGWSPYHAHNSFLQMQLDAGYVGLYSLIFLVATALKRGLFFIARERNPVALWPFAIVLYLVLGSFTETYFGNCNTIEWILFVVAFLYPFRDRFARRKLSLPRPALTIRDTQSHSSSARQNARDTTLLQEKDASPQPR
jgi:O-antigen ligase